MINTCVACEISNHDHPRGHYCPYYDVAIKNPEELAKNCDLQGGLVFNKKKEEEKYESNKLT